MSSRSAPSHLTLSHPAQTQPAQTHLTSRHPTPSYLTQPHLLFSTERSPQVLKAGEQPPGYMMVFQGELKATGKLSQQATQLSSYGTAKRLSCGKAVVV